MDENTKKWLEFLNPESLKSNLTLSSLYIASFESLKDYIVENVKSFYNTGFDGEKLIYSEDYELNVKKRDKNITLASIDWLKENGAIDEQDITIYNNLGQYRNRLAHELMNLMFDGLTENLPEKFAELIAFKIKIEKWWILNIDIPTNPDFDAKADIKESDIVSSTQIFTQIIFDMLLGNEEEANFYRNSIIEKLNNK